MNCALMLGGSRGDTQPYIALALGLARSGHTVTLAAPEQFGGFIEEYGLRHHPIPLDVKSVVSEQLETGTANPVQFVLRSRRAAGSALEEIASAYAQAVLGADLVVYSPFGIFGREAANALGIPAVGALPAPFLCATRLYQHSFFPVPTSTIPVPAAGEMPGLPRRAYNLLSYPLMNQLGFQLLRPAANRGLRKASSVVPGIKPYSLRGPFAEVTNSREPVLHAYSEAVLPKPPEWESKNLHVTGYWHLNTATDWEPPQALREFLAAGEPPVYVGFGSMEGGEEEALTKLIARALSLTGMRGILLSGWGGIGLDARGERLAALPSNVLVVDEVPHDWLFPRVAAAVHHGGAGTTAASLRAGTPTVIVPFFADQKFWGARVSGLGVGPEPISRAKLTAYNLAHAIHVATSDKAMVTRAHLLGRKLEKEDGVGSAIQYLERYLESA